MIVSEVRALVYTLVDEEDATFLTAAKLTTLLQIAYAEFRRLVCSYDTSIYEVTYNFAAPNADSQTLDGTLLGSAATQPRLMKPVRVVQLDAPNGKPTRLFTPAVSYESLLAKQSFGNVCWWLQGRVLRFNAVVGVPFQVQYVSVPTVVWTVGTNYIDDLNDFHDIIALLAISKYKVMDFAANPMHAEELAKRLQDLKAFLSSGRSGDASRYVTEEGQEGGWW